MGWLSKAGGYRGKIMKKNKKKKFGPWTPGHELKYWNKNGIRVGTDIYDRYAKAFNMDKYNFEEKLVADIGCGPFGGVFYNSMKDNIFPIDILADEYNDMNLCSKKIIMGDLHKGLPFEDNYFDYVICTNAIDHIPEVLSGFNEIFRVLNHGGIAFIHVHLRREDQLSKAHIHALDLDKVKCMCKKFEAISVIEEVDWVNDISDRQTAYLTLRKN